MSTPLRPVLISERSRRMAPAGLLMLPRSRTRIPLETHDLQRRGRGNAPRRRESGSLWERARTGTGSPPAACSARSGRVPSTVRSQRWALNPNPVTIGCGMNVRLVHDVACLPPLGSRTGLDHCRRGFLARTENPHRGGEPTLIADTLLCRPSLGQARRNAACIAPGRIRLVRLGTRRRSG